MDQTSQPDKQPGVIQQTVVWSAFLATSWTWVIGMVLPVLLCPIFNFWGWLAFAIPNVIGAAAVGFCNYGRTEEEQESWFQKHLIALTSFSIVTALFQFFVVAWLVSRLIGPVALLLYLVLVFVFTRAGYKDRRRDLVVTMVVFLISLLCFAFFLSDGNASWQQPGFMVLTLEERKNLLWLSSVLCLGFIACPHMDMTLIRARNAVGASAARPVFVVGFGLFFLTMILFTLAYARAIESLPAIPVGFLTGALSIVAFHIIFQAAATTSLHIGELRRRPLAPGNGVWIGLGIAAVWLLFLAGLGRQVQVDPGSADSLTRWTFKSLGAVVPSLAGLDQGEVIYRGFLAFYAFIFPSYAWTAIFHSPQAGPSVTRQGLALVLGLIAAGVASVGFFHNDFFWVFPGVLLILAGPGIAKVIDR